MASELSLYRLRGNRVVPLSLQQIEQTAHKAIIQLNINRKTRHNMAMFVEEMHDYGIVIDVIEEEQWLFITKAMCHQTTIAMPDSLYVRICAGDPEAVFIFFHELGHLLLGHHAALHYSDIPPCRYEDAEWQADEFAKVFLQRMNINYQPEQLTFKF